MHIVTASIQRIGINPYVPLPEPVLQDLFRAHGKDTGPIPVRGTIRGKSFQQNLVRYRGAWRLYINTTMLDHSPRHIGETLEVHIEYDPSDRRVPMPPELLEALKCHPQAKAKFDSLTPSLQKEISRYISRLKSEESVRRNVRRALDFLMGTGSFVGRKPLQ